MSKNIIIVCVTANNRNQLSLLSEGKYIYVENKNKLQIKNKF